MRGSPEDIAEAIEAAISIECALSFADESQTMVHAVGATGGHADHGEHKLLEQVLYHLVESRFSRQEEPQQSDKRPRRRCYRCGKEGHIRRNCH